MSDQKSSFLRIIGPGIAIAATGVGAGDLMAAMIAGADFGIIVAWVIVVGAILKFALNEGIARWQLGTGTSIIEGWSRHFGRPFQLYFLVYLLLWSFIVAGGLMSACGVAGHALIPGVGIKTMAIVHSLVALLLVGLGRYDIFEAIMKFFIGLMVVTLVGCAVLIGPDLAALLRGLFVPSMPSGSAGTILSLMGGVGGSVTLLSYGYWIREKGWSGQSRITTVRLDLMAGYILTAVFGLAVLVLASAALSGVGGMPKGSAGLIVCSQAVATVTSERMGETAGLVSGTVFLVGVWGAIFTSTLGVWQGVPYIFADFVHAFKGRYQVQTETTSGLYRGYLIFLAFPPMLLLFLDRPIWVIKSYTLIGGLFMPILGASLLWLNSQRKLLGELKNGWIATAALVFTLILFAAISLRQIVDVVFSQ